VNQEFARKVLGTENPIGRTFKRDVFLGEVQTDYQVVGLVKNTKYFDLREDFGPLVFFPQAQDDKPSSDTVMIVRPKLDLEALLASLRRAVAEVNPAVTIDFRAFNQQVKQQLVRRQGCRNPAVRAQAT
jgi:putative ABC transport system permease protein